MKTEVDVRSNGVALEMVRGILQDKSLTEESAISVCTLACICGKKRVIPEVILANTFIVGLCDGCMRDTMVEEEIKEITVNEYISELEADVSNMHVASLFQPSFESDLLMGTPETSQGKNCFIMTSLTTIQMLEELKETFFGVIIERKYPGLINRMKEISISAASMGKSYGSCN